MYVYDFGDSWDHEIRLEKILPKDSTRKYPLCIAGEFACPPEDCGGIPGYYNCIKASRSKRSSELKEWFGDWNPRQFNPKEIVFDNPRKRFLETIEA
jgi:hypothetical protein